MYSYKFSLLLGLATLGPLCANENLSLKRITEFWNDEAFDQAKVQILHFMKEYPESEYRDNLSAMLGDLYLQEGTYQEAIASYEQISSKDLKNKVESNYLQALFEIADYHAILQKASKQSEDPKVNFLSGESCFRLGRKAESPETQKMLYVQAAAHYEKLYDSSYNYNTLWPLAEIYKSLGEASKAAALYLELAEKNPEEKENFLFQAAYLQASFDKKAAAKTFKEIYLIGKTNARSAAYNLLMLLFETGEHREFLDAYSQMEKAIPSDKIEPLQFCRGESHFRVNEFEQAVTTLEKCKGKSALILLAACAEKTEDLKLLEKVTKELTSSFPQDPDTAKAHLLSAHLCTKKGDNLRAQGHINHVLSKFPDYPEREKLLCDYALTLYHNTLWGQSREAFETFLSEYPESSYQEEAWRHLLNCALKEGKRDLFTSLLERALTTSNTFQGEEKQRYHILLVKLFLEQSNRQEALTQLIRYMDTYPNAADGHYLAALYHEEEPSLFTLHAEKALALDPQFPESERLHLQLYNFYIQSTDGQNLAAEHLFTYISKNGTAVKEENIRWLAGYYFNQKEDPTARKRALFLYEKITEHNISPSLERECLRHAELLELEGKSQARRELLEKLSEEQQAQANLPWKFQRHALFELAKTYQSAEEYDRAIAAYDLLIRTSTHMPSYFSRAATLERARLQYKLLSPEERNETSEPMKHILTSLKDLQLRKKLHSEPIHLEAALDYVSVMASLAKEEKKTERNVFLLKRVKQDFTERNDLNAKDYQSQRSVLPDQAALLASYLTYIDAEILRLEGKEKRAEKLLQKLQEGAIDPSLQKRINTSMEALYDTR